MSFGRKTDNSLELLFLKKKKLFIGIAFDIIKNYEQVDDILHDTYLAAGKNWEKLCDLDEKNQTYYLIAIIKNKAITQYRQGKKALEKEIFFDETVETSQGITLEHLVISKEQLEETKKNILKLNKDQRIILELSVFHQLPDEAIAEQLNISINLVRVKKHRAREILKKELMEVSNDDK